MGASFSPAVHTSRFGCGVFFPSPDAQLTRSPPVPRCSQQGPAAALGWGAVSSTSPQLVCRWVAAPTSAPTLGPPPQTPSLSPCPCLTSATRLNQICAESHRFHGNVEESEDPKPPGGAAVGGSDALWTASGSPTAPCSVPSPEPLLGPCSPQGRCLWGCPAYGAPPTEILPAGSAVGPVPMRTEGPLADGVSHPLRFPPSRRPARSSAMQLTALSAARIPSIFHGAASSRGRAALALLLPLPAALLPWRRSSHFLPLAASPQQPPLPLPFPNEPPALRLSGLHPMRAAKTPQVGIKAPADFCPAMFECNVLG